MESLRKESLRKESLRKESLLKESLRKESLRRESLRIEFNDGEVRIGSHVQKQKTLVETVFRVLTWRINCAQIYLSNSRGFALPNISIDDIKLTRNLIEYSLFNVYVHACLLYNLNGGTHIDNIDDKIKSSKTIKQKEKFILEKEKIPISFERMKEGLTTELDICSAAFGPKGGVVVHIGSGEIRDRAIKRIAKTIEYVLSESSKYEFDPKLRNIILENSAGEGNKIGSTLEEIRDILKNIKKVYHNQISICIDTCHLYQTGIYDIEKVTEVERFLKDFDKIIPGGIRRLKLIHLNDSRGDFGKHRDIHEALGEGYIFSSKEGKKSLEFIVKYCNENKIDMILETPGGHDNDLDLVYSFK